MGAAGPLYDALATVKQVDVKCESTANPVPYKVSSLSDILGTSSHSPTSLNNFVLDKEGTSSPQVSLRAA